MLTALYTKGENMALNEPKDLLDDLDKNLLRAAVVELRAWHGYQSASSVNNLYNAAGRLFGARFNPAEYDAVE